MRAGLLAVHKGFPKIREVIGDVYGICFDEVL